MPAPYAHIMICDKALEKFTQTIPAAFSGCTLKQFVYLGCAAPDYPYLDAGDSPQKIWADHMHYDFTGEIQRAMVQKFLNFQESDFQSDLFKVLFSWTLGYMSHVVADCVIHPVVMGIVGSYSGHEKDHQYCEMIQDSYIYNKLTNQEIDHSNLIETLKQCSDLNNDRAIHPFVSEFWGSLLKTFFPVDYRHVPPEIDEWHRKYNTILDEDGSVQCIGRFLGLTYVESNDISVPDRMRYITHLHLPDGTQKAYDIPFEMAVDAVAKRWNLLANAIARNDPVIFTSEIVNCNLDTGFEMTKLAFWS